MSNENNQTNQASDTLLECEKNPFIRNKYEIIYKLINCLFPAILVFLTAIIDGKITKAEILLALVSSAIVFIMQFQEYWKSEEAEYSTKLFSFFR